MFWKDIIYTLPIWQSCLVPNLYYHKEIDFFYLHRFNNSDESTTPSFQLLIIIPSCCFTFYNKKKKQFSIYCLGKNRSLLCHIICYVNIRIWKSMNFQYFESIGYELGTFNVLLIDTIVVLFFDFDICQVLYNFTC